MSVVLAEHQKKAIKELKNGSILCGGVGSGKSRTALAYYLFRVCCGGVKVNGQGDVKEMLRPLDLYIITTAKKRDNLEWEAECKDFLLTKDPDSSLSGVKVTIDSWNNIKKYREVKDAFFIFDENRVVGSGTWVKNFLKITKVNQWIILSATPGDTYLDYMPAFIANGFFRNKTDFTSQHCIYSAYTSFPKIERYVGTKRLDELRDSILVLMVDERHTKRHYESVIVQYDIALYRQVMKDRWDPYGNCPIEETGALMYLLRRVCNSDPTRINALDSIMKDKQKCIVFYNFNYELDMLREYAESIDVCCREWNGHKHEDLPTGERWLYLVQYTAGCEGWNCTTTDTIVLFSQNYSYRVLEQARGRIDRMNTPFYDLYYYHLRSTSSIDLAIYSKLKNKKNFNERAFIGKNKNSHQNLLLI